MREVVDAAGNVLKRICVLIVHSCTGGMKAFCVVTWMGTCTVQGREAARVLHWSCWMLRVPCEFLLGQNAVIELFA